MNQAYLEPLTSEDWADWITNDLIPRALPSVGLRDHLIEIGPGPGRTTDVLRYKVDRLTAVELDPVRPLGWPNDYLAQTSKSSTLMRLSFPSNRRCPPQLRAAVLETQGRIIQSMDNLGPSRNIAAEASFEEVDIKLPVNWAGGGAQRSSRLLR